MIMFQKYYDFRYDFKSISDLTRHQSSITISVAIYFYIIYINNNNILLSPLLLVSEMSYRECSSKIGFEAESLKGTEKLLLSNCKEYCTSN